MKKTNFSAKSETTDFMGSAAADMNNDRKLYQYLESKELIEKGTQIIGFKITFDSEKSMIAQKPIRLEILSTLDYRDNIKTFYLKETVIYIDFIEFSGIFDFMNICVSLNGIINNKEVTTYGTNIIDIGNTKH